MSTSTNMKFGEAGNGGFTIKNVHGCRLVFGPIPLSEFGMLTHGFSKKALVAGDIADLIGASFVIGEPKDLEELRKMDLSVSEKRHADYLLAAQKGLHPLSMWLRRGERGASSNAMSKQMFGVPSDAGTSYPSDPDDLRRCVMFLDAAEAHDRIDMMKDVSPEWSRLVEHWDELTTTLSEELTTGVSAPRTYKLMKQALAG